MSPSYIREKMITENLSYQIYFFIYENKRKDLIDIFSLIYIKIYLLYILIFNI